MKKLISRRNSISVNKSDIKYDQCDGDVVNSKIPKLIKPSKLELFFIFFSLTLLVIDVGSDCYLIIKYYIENYITWFILTLIFVVGPAIAMGIFSLILYWNDRKHLPFTTTGWFIRIALHVLLFGPLVRWYDTFVYAVKCGKAKTAEDKNHYYRQMTCENADLSYLRLVECTSESVPQLLLQLYILFTQPKVNNLYLLVIQTVSIFLSTLSPPCCLTSYNSALRRSNDDANKMAFKLFLLFMFWKFLFIWPRMIAIALFTSVYDLYVLIVIGGHYVLMFGFLIHEGTTFFDGQKYSIKEILYNVLMAFVLCVDFVNVKNERTRNKYILFYGLSFIEICVLVLIWYFNPPQMLKLDHAFNDSVIFSNGTLNAKYYYQIWPQHIRVVAVVVILCIFLSGVPFMILYYQCCHPSRGIKNSEYGDAVTMNLIVPTSESTP